MTTPSLMIRDSVLLPDLSLVSDAQQFADETMKKVAGARLLVRSNATYSGYLLNARTYPGKYMEQGVVTWTDAEHGGVWPFCAPVHLSHDMSTDPIGRVVEAAYHRLADGEDFMNDWRKPARGLNKGSGYTRLGMEISDSDSVERFLDGRYKTFSTSFVCPDVWCSICGTNVMRDDRCAHMPGRTYEVEDSDDGKKLECYLITGLPFNKECSVEHNPAQPRAVADEIKVLSDALVQKKNMDIEEFHQKFTLSSVRDSSDTPHIYIADAQGNATLLTRLPGAEDAIPSGDGTVRLSTMVSIPDLNGAPATKVQDATEPEKEMSDEELSMARIAKSLLDQGLLKTDEEIGYRDFATMNGEAVAYMSGLTLEDGSDHIHSYYLTFDLKKKVLRGWTNHTWPKEEDAEVEAHDHSIEIPIKDLNKLKFEGDSREANFGESHTHKIKVIVSQDAEMLPSWDDLFGLIEKFSDEQLTDIQKSSIFCGPNRSFPVSTCADVIAARRLVGRAKLSDSQKQKVLDQVNIKAAKLGCDKQDAKNHNKEKIMSEKTPAPTADKAEDKQDEQNPLVIELGQKQEQISALQSERDQKDAEIQKLTDALAETKGELHQERCARLAERRVLTRTASDGFDLATIDKVEAHAKELEDRTPESVSDALKDEEKAFAARVDKVRGLPNFISNTSQPEPAGGTRIQDDLEAPEKAKDDDNDEELV